MNSSLLIESFQSESNIHHKPLIECNNISAVDDHHNVNTFDQYVPRDALEYYGILQILMFYLKYFASRRR